MLQSSFSPKMLREEALQRIREIQRIHRVRAPEFPPDCHWLNAPPLTLKSLRGKIVLLDFWTYCCINCLHILPDLQFLEEKYARSPLAVIGVHSGKFPNEQDPDNIKEAVLRHSVAHPIIVDSDLQIWDEYSIKAWPTVVLIDPEGYIIASFSGEGNLEIMDAYISAALEIYRTGQLLNYVPIVTDLESNYQYSQTLSYPTGVLADEAGNRLFIADTQHHRVLVCNLRGDVKTVIGNGKAGFRNGDFSTASFREPCGMALVDDILFVADAGNHTIRKVDLQHQLVKTAAGNGEQAKPRRQTGGKALETPLNSPWDITALGNNLYIAMAGLHQIWRLNLTTGIVEPFAGSGREAKRDDSLAMAMFAQPAAICSDGQHLFVADSESSTVRKIDLQNGTVETLAGGDLFVFGDENGPGELSLLQHPMGLAWYSGSLFVSDTYNHKIKKLDLAASEIHTFTGSERGYLDGKRPVFYEPCGISIAKNALFVADTNNHQIRKVSLKTGAAKTLILKGLGDALARQKGGAFFGRPAPLEEITLPRQSLASNTTVEIAVHIHLPDGHAFNGGSPFEYGVIADPKLFSGETINHIQSLAAPQEQRVVVGTTGNIRENGEIGLELRYFYCSRGRNSLCLLRSVQYRIPVRISADGKNRITVDDRPQ